MLELRPLEEGMVTHSNILAWRIPWTEEPCGLQSTGSQTARNGKSDPASIDTRLFFFFFCLWQLCPSEGWHEGA